MNAVSFILFFIALMCGLVAFVYNITGLQQVALPVFWICLPLFIAAAYLTHLRNHVVETGRAFSGLFFVVVVMGISMAVLSAL